MCIRFISIFGGLHWKLSSVIMASGKHGLPAPFQGGEGATRFFKRFEVACLLNKWTKDDEMALHVLPLFGDTVFDFASSLSDTDLKSYEKLKVAIIKQYDAAILTSSVVEHAVWGQEASIW